MIVICKRGTKRLIKGHRYEVRQLWNSQNGRTRGRVFLENIGAFAVSGFTTTDGNELPQIDYTKPNIQPRYNTLNFDDLSVGDVLVCKSDRYKTFVQNGMYKIEDLIVNKKSRLSFRLNQANSLSLNVRGATSIIRHNLPPTVNISLQNQSLIFSGSPTTYGAHTFTIKLDGHEDVKGRISFNNWGQCNISDDSDRYIKFVGVARKMKFNGWKFRKLNAEEAREQALSHILDGEEVKVITSTDKRNIELVDDKDDILLKTLAKSILDPNRHHLSIVDWASTKNGDKLEIESKDYEPYLNMTLAQILEKIK
jgi:hypothetical protein